MFNTIYPQYTHLVDERHTHQDEETRSINGMMVYPIFQ